MSNEAVSKNSDCFKQQGQIVLLILLLLGTFYFFVIGNFISDHHGIGTLRHFVERKKKLQNET